jgi:hypothetical protein
VFSITPGQDTLRVGAALDYGTATSHQVTITSDNGVDPAITETFTIEVTEVVVPDADLIFGTLDAAVI